MSSSRLALSTPLGGRIETPRLLIWGLATIVGLLIATNGSWRFFGNDDGQILSTIDNLLAGRGLVTSAPFYDFQVEMGVPAPQTVWPPLLIVLTAAISTITGLDPASVLPPMNAVFHALSAALLYDLLRRYASGWSAAAVASLWLIYWNAWPTALAGASEHLCVLLVLAGLAAAQRAWPRPGAETQWRWVLAASAAFGAAVATRYQMIGFIGALGLAAAARPALERRFGAAIANGAVAGAPALLVLSALFIRNIVVTGRLTGGPLPTEPNGVGEIVVSYVHAALQVLGANGPLTLLLALALVFAGGAALATTARDAWARPSSVAFEAPLTALAGAIATVSLVFLLSLTTATYVPETRYFVIVLPAVAMGLAAMFAGAGTAAPLRLWSARAAAVAALGLTIVNSAAAIGASSPSETVVSRIEAALADIDVADGDGRDTTLLALLRAEAGADAPVFTNQSQSLYTVLRAPTVGVAERRLTRRAWTGDEVLARIDAAGSAWVVLFRDMPLAPWSPGADLALAADTAIAAAALEVVHVDDAIAVYRMR